MPFDATNMLLSAKGFHAFPAEIRQLIFKQSLASSWTGKTPALVQALSGSKLYLEAFDVFVRTNSYKLCRENSWGFSQMSPTAISHVLSLEIEFSLWGSYREDVQKVFSIENAWKLKNIRGLILDTKHVFPIGARQDSGILYATMLARTFDIILAALNEQVSELRLLTSGYPHPLGGPDIHRIPSDSPFKYFGNNLVRYFNSILSQDAVLTPVESSTEQEWVWKGDGPEDFIRLSGE